MQMTDLIKYRAVPQSSVLVNNDASVAKQLHTKAISYIF